MLNLPGLHLDHEHTAAVARMMADAAKETTYQYPWDTLQQDLQAARYSQITIVGYGSLVNRTSAAHTVREQSIVTAEPIVAFGVRRLFNYEMPTDLDRYDPPINPSARAALNVHVTGKVHDVVNGVTMTLSLEEIPALRQRELYYDLVPVACLRWNQIQDPPFLAHILSHPDRLPDKEPDNDKILEPHRHYYSLCRDGASQFGEEFLRLWLATTYLADAVTPVAQWETDAFSERKEDDTGPRKLE